MTASPFAAADLERYAEDGYVVVPGLFQESDLAAWRDRLQAIADEVVPPARDMLVMRDVMVAKGAVTPRSRLAAIQKLQDFHHDPVLFGYASHPALLDRVEAFVGPDVKCIHTMLIAKPPEVDGRHPIHQDLLYFPFRPAERIVSVWTALERCTRENGCLVVLPGTQRGGLLPHELPGWEYVNAAYFGAKEVSAASERVHLEMEPGDTVFFSPLLLHGSGRNRSDGFRRAISAHYASSACRYLPGGEGARAFRHYKLVRGVEHEGGL
jgi:phytanoyl-CoA hydroxylase